MLRSEASPLYLILFLTATYFLNRPCVYCSLLLGILVIALFDFSGDWFADRSTSGTPSLTQATNSSSPMLDVLVGSISAVASAINASAAAKEAIPAADWTRPSWRVLGLEWIRNVVGRREWKVPCINTVLRL